MRPFAPSMATFAALAAQKRAFQEHILDDDADAGFRLGVALYAHKQLTDPLWPTQAERQIDFEDHVALATKLQKLGPRLPRR